MDLKAAMVTLLRDNHAWADASDAGYDSFINIKK